MTKKEAIKIFEEKKVRTVWDNETEEWFFSVVDVVAILTDSPNPSNYWKVLKHRLRKEGNESFANRYPKLFKTSISVCLSNRSIN